MTNIFRHAESEGIWHLWTIVEGKNANLINNSSQLSDEAKKNKIWNEKPVTKDPAENTESI